MYCIATLDFCCSAHSHITVFRNYQISTSDITMVQYFLKKRYISRFHMLQSSFSSKKTVLVAKDQRGIDITVVNFSEEQNAGDQRLKWSCGLTLWDLVFARLLVAILYEKWNKNHQSHMFIKMAISVFSPSMVFIMNLSCDYTWQ